MTKFRNSTRFHLVIGISAKKRLNNTATTPMYDHISFYILLVSSHENRINQNYLSIRLVLMTKRLNLPTFNKVVESRG